MNDPLAFQSKGIENMKLYSSRYLLFLVLTIPIVLTPLKHPSLMAQEKSGEIQEATPTAVSDVLEQEEGMTLYDLLVNGGWVMAVLALLSVLALTLTVFFAFTLTQRKLVPKELLTQVRHFLRDGRYEDIGRLCRRHKGLFAKVVLAGAMRGHSDPTAMASTMEAVGRRESENLMRRVRYLSDIGTVAPMLGLLGTVLGMIRAFNFIAFDISAVKPVALASAVAQALVTTAAGLIVAIPCMGFFFYFRGKLQASISEVEEFAVEMADMMSMDESKDSSSRKRSSSPRKSRKPVSKVES